MVATDLAWFGKDEAGTWPVEQANRLLTFFYNEGIDSYGSLYTLNGTCTSTGHSAGLIAMNAVGALASDQAIAYEFVDALYELAIPTGSGRYYNGMLYMWALLFVSGEFKIYL